MANADYNPFAGLDFSKFDMRKAFGEFKVPGVDMQALMQAQQENIAALMKANQHVVEGLQALARREMEVLQRSMKSATEAAKDVASAGGPAAAATKQVELAKSAFEQAVTDMREMAEIVAKANDQAIAAITQRISTSLEEIKGRMNR
jgi:phasin family protein